MAYGQVVCVLNIIIICILVPSISSFCFTVGPTSADKCEYQDRVFPLNSSFKDYKECMEYSCLTDGTLSVCGLGINAGVILPPPGCVVIKGKKCEAKLVDADDNEAECDPNPSSDETC